MEQKRGGKSNQSDHSEQHSCRCCSHGVPNIDEKTFFGMSRRDFLMGLGAAGVGAMALSSNQAKAAAIKPISGMGLRIGSTLRVKPALVYSIHQRRQATSWRSWGGLHTQSDVEKEAKKIEQELKKLSSSADFPMEVLPVSLVRNVAQANEVKDTDCDVNLVYAAKGGRGELDTIAASKKPTVMFLRHNSGPVYLWYEIAHPHFLRRATDDYQQPDMDVWDVVVDDYNEILWRMRSLYGLKNTLGTKIVAIGGAGGWGAGYEFGPKNAREIWKLDIQPVEYKELEPMIKKVRADEKAVKQAQRQTDEFLARKGFSLHTDKKFLVNAYLLTRVFKDLMERANAPAITVHHCMGTIMPMSQTTACMPLNFINDEGLMAFCESDFVVIPSGILLRYISGTPAFLNDPTHPHDGMITLAHCTAPSRMNGKDFEPTEVHTHFESDYGAAPKVNMRKGQVITNLIPSFTSKKWIGYRGKIIDHPFYDICRAQIDTSIEGDWKKLLTDMQGFHWMTGYGDYLREVGYALKKVGIEFQDLTNGSTV
ncbi:MAG: twin-arginine translocation signal domain-containing protein, partial [Sedimentisphaerales bacterium]